MLNSRMTSISNWYVLYTYPNYEKKVNHALEIREVPCFLPLYKATRQWSDRKKTVEMPLFPNYVFVNPCDIKRFDILNIYGVAKYVAFNGKPVKIQDQVIDQIRKMMVDPSVTVEPCLKKGDSIRIIDGPFHNLEGIILERKGRTKIGVNIEWMNRCISIEVPLLSVRKTF